MKANKDVIEAAFYAWNEITSTLDDHPAVFEDIETFKPFYKKMLSTLFQEEESQ